MSNNTEINGLVHNLTLPTTGGTPSILDFYEEATLSSTFSGPFTSGSIDIKIRRIGKIVVLCFPDIVGTGVAVARLQMDTLLPVRFRAGFYVIEAARVWESGVRSNTPGWIDINTTGRVEIFPDADGSGFNIGGQCGLTNSSATYVLA